MLEFKKWNCVETIPLPELCAVVSLCKLLESLTFDDLAEKIPDRLINDDYNFLIKIWFIFW